MWNNKRDEIRDNMQNEIQSVLTNWEVLGTAKQIYSTAWAISDEYVLKAYDNLEQLKKNGRMQMLLCRMGIPAAEFIQTRRGEIYAAEGSRYYMLSRKLPGSNAADIKADGMAEKMGEVLGACIRSSVNVRKSCIRSMSLQTKQSASLTAACWRK